MIIIGRKVGQLGNRLFLFAHFIAWATEHDLTVLNPSFDEYADFFDSTREDVFCRYPRRKMTIPAVHAVRHSFYLVIFYMTALVAKMKISTSTFRTIVLRSDEEIFSLDDEHNMKYFRPYSITAVSGWLFRGERNVIKHQDIIRSYFVPSEPYKSRIEDLLQRARGSSDVLMGVHIRRGDYQYFQEGRFFYCVEDYIDIMYRLVSLFPGRRVGYIVCSDDDLEAEAFLGLNVTFGNNHVLEDMYSLASCDYIVGPPSTYSMWASFYGKVPLCVLQSPKQEVSFNQFTVV